MKIFLAVSPSGLEFSKDSPGEACEIDSGDHIVIAAKSSLAAAKVIADYCRGDEDDDGAVSFDDTLNVNGWSLFELTPVGILSHQILVKINLQSKV